jgi:hypothetical protein
MNTKEILTIIGLSITFAGLINAVLYQFWFLPKVNKSFRDFESSIKQKELINQERWQLKRAACLKALNIADCILSNYKYENVKSEDILPTPITTEEVRQCFNELACTCDRTEVIELLKKILYDKSTPDIIVDLRNGVRRELEFGNADFDKDRTNAFVGKIGADPKIKK